MYPILPNTAQLYESEPHQQRQGIYPSLPNQDQVYISQPPHLNLLTVTSSLGHSLPATGDTEVKFRRFAKLTICADSSYAGSIGHIL